MADRNLVLGSVILAAVLVGYAVFISDYFGYENDYVAPQPCIAPNLLIDGQCCTDTDGDGRCGGEAVLSTACLPPKVTIGNECCLDGNGDGVCGGTETPRESSCTDSNGDAICD